MLKQELIYKIVKYFKLNKPEAEKIVNDVFDAIMKGVKNEKIVDISEFGEFIIKYNGKGRSIEFLPSISLENELNELPEKNSHTSEKRLEVFVDEIQENNTYNIDDDIRIKRDAILKEIHSSSFVESISGDVIITNELVSGNDEKKLNSSTNGNHSEKSQPVKEDNEINEIDKESRKSFSDFFADKSEDTPVYELNQEEKPPVEEPEKEVPEVDEPGKKEPKQEPEYEPVEEPDKEINPVEIPEKDEPMKLSDEQVIVTEETVKHPEEQQNEQVIDPQAVALHNEIVGDKNENEIITDKSAEEEVKPEKKTGENSYYLWFKDSESTPVETQTLSYEYELLYQAQKEAEYKSKLKIYVTTFILFFSFVLLLLIFSPVIYKVIFTPVDMQYTEETQSPERRGEGVNEENNDLTPPVTSEQQTSTEQQPTASEQPPTATEQQPTASEQQPEQNVQPEQKQITTPEQTNVQTPPTESEGLSKNSLGWSDDKNKVIYTLDNNQYSIQESAWDTEAKAQKRIKTVESFNIAGLTGRIVKVEIEGRGTWYRARFGEFASLGEARAKAKELRDKERTRLQAILFVFLMYT